MSEHLDQHEGMELPFTYTTPWGFAVQVTSDAFLLASPCCGASILTHDFFGTRPGFTGLAPGVYYCRTCHAGLPVADSSPFQLLAWDSAHDGLVEWIGASTGPLEAEILASEVLEELTVEHEHLYGPVPVRGYSIAP